MKFLRQGTVFSVFLMSVFGVFLTACGGGGGGIYTPGSLPRANFEAAMDGSIQEKTLNGITLKAESGTLAGGSEIVVYESDLNEGGAVKFLSVASKLYSLSVKTKNKANILSSVNPIALTVKNNMTDADELYLGSRKANSGENWVYTLIALSGGGSSIRASTGLPAVGDRVKLNIFKFDREYVLLGRKFEAGSLPEDGVIESVRVQSEPAAVQLDENRTAYKENINIKFRVKGRKMDSFIGGSNDSFSARIFYQNDKSGHIESLVSGGSSKYTDSNNLEGSGKGYLHTVEVSDLSDVQKISDDEIVITLTLNLENKKLSDFPKDFFAEIFTTAKPETLPFSCQSSVELEVEDSIKAKLIAPEDIEHAPANLDIKISFTSAVSEPELGFAKYISFKNALGVDVANCVYSLNSSKTILTIQHDELDFNTNYILGIKPGIKGPNMELSPATFSFKTEDEFAGGDGTEASPYLIATANQLNNVRNHLSSHFKQLRDISLREYPNWMPIGSKTDMFKGSYDGNGNKITDLCIEREYYTYVGLFSCMDEDSLVKNLGIEISSEKILGNHYSGSIVGYLEGGAKIINCYSIGDIKGLKCTGGIAGFIIGEVKNCHFEGNVVGCEHVGGVVGYARDSNIDNCYHVGNIEGAEELGGIVGCGYETKISKCHFLGNIEGTEDEVGGVVGHLSGGSIDSCYSYANIKCLTRGGGIIGIAGRNVEMTSCYFVGDIEGNEYIGGLIAKSYARLKLSDCYAGCGALTASEEGGKVSRIASIDEASIGTISNCYALDSMLVNGAVVTSGQGADNTVGANVSDSQLKTKSWWVNILNAGENSTWSNENIWDYTNIADNKFPKLK